MRDRLMVQDALWGDIDQSSAPLDPKTSPDITKLQPLHVAKRPPNVILLKQIIMK